jgi:hypothetical protein
LNLEKRKDLTSSLAIGLKPSSGLASAGERGLPILASTVCKA